MAQEVEYPPDAHRRMVEALKGKFKPTVVVSIGTAGTIFGERIAAILGVPHRKMVIKIQPKKAGLLAKIIHRERKLLTPLDEKLSPNDRILIVDDNAKQGLTLKVAKRHLVEMGANPKNVKSVVYRTSIKAWPTFAVERQTPLFASRRRKRRMIK